MTLPLFYAIFCMTKLFETKDGKNFLVPFVLITSLFFLWGFAHSILDVLNKHFQDTLGVSKTSSALVQAMVYGGYFIMAIPAGKIISKWGYRTGVLTGLGMYGCGALLFIPGSELMSFGFFLFSLFVIGCGLTCLETAANPYVTVLGEQDSASRRINLAQSFNGLGWICGPLVGGFFLFSENGEADIATPYAIIGVLVLIIALVFSRINLPEVDLGDAGSTDDVKIKTGQGVHGVNIWSLPTFTVGLIALFLYVAAQTGINSFFINFVTEYARISAHEASLWLSFGGMGLFVAGRLVGSWLMTLMSGERVLGVCGLMAVIAMLCVMVLPGEIAMYFFFLCFFAESIMFPTIFALAISETGVNTKKASSFLIMSIVGGAIAPLVMGFIADNISIHVGFVVPLICFAFISVYAFCYRKMRK